MIKRNVVLISCPGPEDNYLPGSLQDLGNMENFMCSPRGGATERSEIIKFPHAHWKDVKEYLKSATADYQIVYFSGHGYMKGDKRFLCFEDADVCDTDLLTHNTKQLIVVDACREYISGIWGIPEMEDEWDSFTGVTEARLIFDDYIQKSDEGKLIVHAALAGETASDDRYGDGGAFTLSLLWSALKVNTGREFTPIHISQLLPIVKKRLHTQFYYQSPEITDAIGNLTVPFALDVPYRIKDEITIKEFPSPSRKSRNDNVLLKVAGIALAAIILGDILGD